MAKTSRRPHGLWVKFGYCPTIKKSSYTREIPGGTGERWPKKKNKPLYYYLTVVAAAKRANYPERLFRRSCMAGPPRTFDAGSVGRRRSKPCVPSEYMLHRDYFENRAVLFTPSRCSNCWSTRASFHYYFWDTITFIYFFAKKFENRVPQMTSLVQVLYPTATTATGKSGS